MCMFCSDSGRKMAPEDDHESQTEAHLPLTATPSLQKGRLVCVCVWGGVAAKLIKENPQSLLVMNRVKING